MAVTLSKSTTKTTGKRADSAVAAGKRIIPASKAGNKFKIALYARNKVGKTQFACSSGLDTLLLDFNEEGYDTVRKYKNVSVYKCPTWDDVDPIYWYLRTGKHKHEVIVLDTMTMLASIGMKWVLKDNLERDMNADPRTPSQQSYLKLNEMMKDAIIKFRNLPYHIIFNVQEKVSTDEDDDGNVVTEVHPELSPGSRSTLLSATNLIGRLFVKQVEVKGKKKMERRMLTTAIPGYAGGSRFKQLRPIERNPNLADFIERVYGDKNA